MAIFRKAIFWAHLLTALVVGVIVVIMSATGVLLTYQRQITAWADTRGLDGSAPSTVSERLPAETLLASAPAIEGGEPTAITWYSDADAPAMIAYGRVGRAYVNAYTGELLGRGSGSVREFFTLMTDWHRWLARSGEERDSGRAITGAANLGFLFIVISGLYLWWPRNWNRAALRNITVFRSGLRGKARDFNWHNVIGFWSLVPLFLIVFSGVMISYPWATALVYRIAGDTPPPPAGAAAQAGRSGAGAGGERREEPELALGSPLAGSAHLEAIAEAQVEGWRSISVALPGTAEALTYTIDTGDGGQPHKRATLALNRATGDVERWEPFSAGTPGRQLRSFLRFAHTGEVGGLPGQTLAGLVSAGALVLVWTGFFLTWRRFTTWRGRANRPGVVEKPAERKRTATV